MVLQNRYKRAASARYNNTPSSGSRASAPALEPASHHLVGAEDTSSSQLQSGATFRRRGLLQVERYREEEEDEEPTDEDMAIQKQEADELEAFLKQQADRQQAPSFALASPNSDDLDDVDDSFAHLKTTGSRKLRVALPPTHGEASLCQHPDEDTSERLRSARALKARLQAPRRSSEGQSTAVEAAWEVDDLLTAIGGISDGGMAQPSDLTTRNRLHNPPPKAQPSHLQRQ